MMVGNLTKTLKYKNWWGQCSKTGKPLYLKHFYFFYPNFAWNRVDKFCFYRIKKVLRQPTLPRHHLRRNKNSSRLYRWHFNQHTGLILLILLCILTFEKIIFKYTLLTSQTYFASIQLLLLYAICEDKTGNSSSTLDQSSESD